MNKALLIIDVQNDYFKDGKLPLYNADEALNNIVKLENHFLSNNQEVIYIKHIKNQKNADFFEVNTYGAELHPQLSVTQNSNIIEKQFPNSFYETNLQDILIKKKISQLVICGMMTHMCVDSTTRTAKELGFDPVLIHDATATKDLLYNNKKVAADAVQNSFIAALTNFSNILSTEDFVNKY